MNPYRGMSADEWNDYEENLDSNESLYDDDYTMYENSSPPYEPDVISKLIIQGGEDPYNDNDREHKSILIQRGTRNSIFDERNGEMFQIPGAGSYTFILFDANHIYYSKEFWTDSTPPAYSNPCIPAYILLRIAYELVRPHKKVSYDRKWENQHEVDLVYIEDNGSKCDTDNNLGGRVIQYWFKLRMLRYSDGSIRLFFDYENIGSYSAEAILTSKQAQKISSDIITHFKSIYTSLNQISGYEKVVPLN